MQIFHKGLRELLLLNHFLNGHKIGFLSIECPIPELLKKITNAIPSYSVGLQFRREYRHLSMGLQALRLLEVDSIFVMEAYNQHLLFLLPMLALTGKRIFIGIHGNQQFAQESLIKALGLGYLKFYLNLFDNFKVVLFEIDDHLVESRYQFPLRSKIVIPHPMISDVKPLLKPGERLDPHTKVKIGLVGIIRQDKPIGKILEKLQTYLGSHSTECELILGLPLAQKPSYLEQFDITIYDTTKDDDYLKVLQKIDILVTEYDSGRYYYRASGVISDAVSCGCYIIAPDYPVLRHQITWTEVVGSLFSSLDDLDELLNQAIIHVRNTGKDNQWKWREKRGAEYISQILFAY